MRAASTPVSPQLVFGLFVMALGVVLGLDSLGIADAGYVIRFWPVGLMLLGGTIATRPEAHGRFWGFVWIFVGAWLLLRRQPDSEDAAAGRSSESGQHARRAAVRGDE